ncbi:hypothetical protein BFR57_04790 [Idiomarina sp. MD25a]|uniref:tetratricopeptide repeat protein n=1 Tax=Idiomarina sp. MD25a TaxID=1889913 RepID=UPI0008F93566|nr:tetratricopeptide repeat protein [Idiomarina sp. MD25a]OIM99873.1 hypothetical protein BFR57_04790 [Idiomarina sp. MD25a]
MKKSIGLLVLCLSACTSTPQSPQYAQYQLGNAKAWYEQGDLLSAEQQLNALHQNGAGSAASWRLLGNIHLRQHRLEAAREAYQKSVQLNPHEADVWHNLALTELRQTTATLMRARTQLQRLPDEDERLLALLLKLQRVNIGNEHP